MESKAGRPFANFAHLRDAPAIQPLQAGSNAVHFGGCIEYLDSYAETNPQEPTSDKIINSFFISITFPLSHCGEGFIRAEV
jgi:hypothetical protein